jgi:unsaturated rhamnogalacturonyl hydrolase
MKNKHVSPHSLLTRRCLPVCLSLLVSLTLYARQPDKVSRTLPWSVRMTQSEIIRNPESWQLDFQTKLKWDYCHGLELQAMLDVFDRYGDERIYRYALAYADTMVNADGSIKTYRLEEYNIDRLNSGKLLFRIYERTKDDKYRRALALLRSQLDTHPRNADGGFWHKLIYPHQVWLDGIYMGAPFYAEYAYRNDRVNDYADVVNQFLMAARHTFDAKNNLFRHACDVSRKERWADPITGQSAHSWGRALGWYAMALVDALDFIPRHEAGRDSMLVILQSVAGMIRQRQDDRTGVWYQVLDRSGDDGNYLESSCSAMFTYALLKAVRRGYIDRSYLTNAVKGYQGILKQFIKVDDDGLVSITKACSVAGLGGKQYRSGSYDYYLSEPIRTNDAKAVGPFIMASLEWERLKEAERIIETEQYAEQNAYKHELTVARDGTGDYRSLTEAMKSIRAFMDYTVTVRVKNGVYKEKVIVPSWLQNIVIEGESADSTIITYDDHANIGSMGTFRTYTLRVDGDNITFRNLTIENNAPQMGQAVALHTQGDRLTFINCRLIGNQDTVLTGHVGGMLYFKHCYIEGTTDFIFGPSTALFEECEIHSKRNSYITAASTPQEVAIGYVFHRCRLTAAAGVDRVYLGRPWRPYAMTVFMECELGAHILPDGWHNWDKTTNERTARYAEYANTGAGAATANRVKWAKQLTKKEASKLLMQVRE